MDNQKPDPSVEGTPSDIDEMEEEDVEVTRDELIAALQEVVQDLSTGLKGSDRDAYLSADDLAQNDWFFAGVSDEEGQYAVTMWPAEGEEEMLRIDIGDENAVHELAGSQDQIAALTDDFIDAMNEDYEEYDEEEEEYEEDEDEDEDEEAEGEEEYEEEGDEEIDAEEEERIGRDGNLPPR